MFKVVDVTHWTVDEVDEQLGTKEKDWLRTESGQRWLFKQVRANREGHPGEDWAEKVVEQLGQRLGVPMAEVELAVRDGQRGVISQNFVPDGARLEHGNELLVRVDPEYDRDQDRRNERYTTEAVKLALSDAAAPDAYAFDGFSAFDVWAGYLVLDAWVAGRDRHHENWAVVAGPLQRRVLAPSFDHGNALGFQETPERHARMAADETLMGAWAARGRSHHFAGKPVLVDLALAALEAASDLASGTWLTNLAQVSEDEVVGVIDQVPSDLMSEATRSFCRKLLLLNQRRLCDVG